MVDDLIVEFLF